MQINLTLPNLYPAQRAAFFNDAAVAAIEASTKAGKSVGALCWQLVQGLQVSRGKAHCWIAPVYPQAKVMYRRVCRWLTSSGSAGSWWQRHDSELRIALPGGGDWWFKGSDNPDSIYGSDYASVVIDEASRCKEEAYHAAVSTLTATGGPLRAIGNVRGRGNWFYNLCRQAQSGAKGTRYAKITALDAVAAGVIRQEVIDMARARLPSHVFDELYMCKPSDDGANPFGLMAIDQCIREMSDGQPVCYGADVAKVEDWTVVVGLDGEGTVCRLERWRKPWKYTRQTLAEIIRDAPTLVDQTGAGAPLVEDLQALDLPVDGFTFTAASKQELMEDLGVAIQRNSIGIPDGWLADELRAFEYEYYDGGRKLRYSAPSGVHDDAVCALALAWRHHRSGVAVNLLDSLRVI